MRPVLEVMRLLVLAGFLAALCAACVSDIRYRRIPNWTVSAIACLFIPWAVLGGPGQIPSSLAAALVALLLSVAMYAFRLLGAGDSKLLAACALFVGWASLLQFFVIIALAGGVLAIAILSAQPMRAMVMFQMGGKGGLHRGVPYGVAIAIAAICVVAWPQSQMAMTAILAWMH